MESLLGSPFQVDHREFYQLLELRGGDRPCLTFERLLTAAREVEDIGRWLEAMMSDGWRAELVGAVAIWARPEPRHLELLWQAFDRGSWVAPQLAVVAWSCDPDFESQARRRLLLGCPLLAHPRYAQDSPEDRVDPRRTAKNRAALMTLLVSDEAGRQWLQQRITLDQAVQLLLIDDADGVPSIVASWTRGWQHQLKALGEPLPRPLQLESNLLELWPLDAPDWLLSRQVFDDLFAPLLRAGASSFSLQPRDDGDRLVSDTGFSCSLRSPWHRLFRHIVAQQPDWIPLEGLPLLRTGELELGRPCHWQQLSWKALRLQLSPLPLQDVPGEVLAYGTDDSGLLDSGAGSALLERAGPGLQEELRQQLFDQERPIGSVVVTSAHGLAAQGVKRVCHILSLSRAARCCPEPANLAAAVDECLQQADSRESLVMTSLASGGGGAAPRDIAAMMVERVLCYFRRRPGSRLRVTFSLPNPRDYHAFEQALAEHPDL